jgi:hypothetical protein
MPEEDENKYGVRCPGCDATYIDALIQGVSMLLHKGFVWGDPNPRLPTPQCISSISYVRFKYEGKICHCAPAIFNPCPDCRLGRRSDEACKAW